MPLDRRDLAKLRWPLSITLGLALLAVTAAYLSFQALDKAQADQRTALARHAAMEQRLKRLGDDREEIGKRAELYRRLQQSRLIGEEQRLEWSELLSDLQRRLRLPDLSYRLAPPRPLAGGNAPEFRASAMQLHLELFHEEELIDFLARLEEEASALVLTRSCRLTRKPPGESGSPARLRADCELDWVTLEETKP